MSHNADIVRRVFDAFRSRDLDALLGLLDPEVEIRSLMTESERPLYRGHDGAQEWLAAVVDVFPDWQPAPGEPRVVGDAGVVTPLMVAATGSASGVPIDQRLWHAARLREGRILAFGFYRSEPDALAAVSAQPAAAS